MKSPSKNWKYYFEANQKMWNDKTGIHRKSAFYDVDGFIKGKSSLNQIELEEMGDVAGKKLLHLQCHFGLDTLSWARLGAKVTGIDFSMESIQAAEELKNQAGLDGRFIYSNVYDLPNYLNDHFDIVFTSYGVLGWLPDLIVWAKVVRQFLKPGGLLYLVEFHPMVWMFDDEFKKIKYPYISSEVIEEEEAGTYTDRNAPIHHTSYGWNHGLSTVINALIDEGLNIKFVNEHFSSPYNIFPEPVQDEKGYWRIKSLAGKIPMLYSLMACHDPK